MKVVTVEWVDAFSPESAWLHVDQIPEDIPDAAKVTSIGYLVSQDEDGVWLAMGYTCDDRVCNTFFIPNGMVRGIEDYAV